MKEDNGKELADEFLAGIGKAMRGMGAVFRKELEGHGITMPQAHMLKVVGQRGEVTVTELSHMMMIAAPTASRMINGLCGKGLLKKAKDRTDHRVSRVRLTGKSRRLLANIRDLQSEIFVEVLEGEDRDEIEACVHRLGEMADRWCEIAEKRARSRSENG